MPSFLDRLTGGRSNAPAEQKSQTYFALTDLGAAQWSRRGFVALANEGFAKNPVVYRCVRMIAEAANRVPLTVREDGREMSVHPVLDLINRPNPHQSGPELLESLYAYLQTAGNAYLEAAIVEGEVRALYGLRPDRMKVVAGKDGWPEAYDYTAGGKTMRLSQSADPVARVLHLTLFHPLDDHYGLAPLEAAQVSLDTHNSAANWNKSRLDNAARPSGALVYSAASGNLSADQFGRLGAQLEQGVRGGRCRAPHGAGRRAGLEDAGAEPARHGFHRRQECGGARDCPGLGCRPCCSAFPATIPMPIMPRPTAPSGGKPLCRWCAGWRRAWPLA